MTVFGDGACREVIKGKWRWAPNWTGTPDRALSAHADDSLQDDTASSSCKGGRQSEHTGHPPCRRLDLDSQPPELTDNQRLSSGLPGHDVSLQEPKLTPKLALATQYCVFQEHLTHKEMSSWGCSIYLIKPVTIITALPISVHFKLWQSGHLLPYQSLYK